MLPPNTIYGRYITNWEVFKNATLAIGTVPFLIGGVLLGSLAVKVLESDPYAPNSGLFSCNDAYDNLIGCDIKPTELSKILSNHRSGKGTEGAVSDSSDTATEDAPQDGFLNIYITGSVAYDSGQYDYFFEIDGQPVQPWSLGYRVYDITDCSAMLVDVNNSDNRFKATCKHGEKSL